MVSVKHIVCVGLIFLVFACKKSAVEVTVTQQLEAFHEVQINSPFDIELQEDSSFYIELIGFQETVDAIDVRLSDGVLKLENQLKGRFLKPKINKVKVRIHAQSLALVQANETCHISTVNPITSAEFGLIMKSKGNFADLELDTESFYFWNNYPCGGKLNLWGKTDQLKVWSSAIYTVDAQNLLAKYALIENNSKGNCMVQVTEALEYKIKGEGNLFVFGSPSLIVEREHSGTGQFLLK